MKTKLEAVILPISLLLLAVLVCPQTVGAQTGHGVQSPSGFHPYLAQTMETNNDPTPTMQALEGDVTQQSQIPLMIVIIVVAFAVYIAVIVVLASKKIR